MYTERDKFLEKAIGNCVHEFTDEPNASIKVYNHYCDVYREEPHYKCIHCNFAVWEDNMSFNVETMTPDGREFNTFFSSWEGFGILFHWAQEQTWWGDWKESHEYRTLDGAYTMNMEWFIEPDRFANSIYEFLKEKGE